MNKKSRKRAFFVYVIICLLYLCVTFRVTEKVSMQRTSDELKTPSKGMILPVPGTGQVEEDTDRGVKETVRAPAQAAARPVETGAAQQSGIEPSLLISIPVICYAIREGWVEKESLIFSKKDAYNNVTWKKPIEILKEHDEEGIRNILNTIGKKRVVEFIRKAGIRVGEGLGAEEIILGRGYSVNEDKLIELYDRYVSNSCDELFPFSLKEVGIAKTAAGFRVTKGKETSKESHRIAEAEWMMPNLTNLPLKVAVEKLSVYTSKIKVHGNGYVLNQNPRAFERLKGEWECTIQGRAQSR